MLNSTQAKILTFISALAVATAVNAQVLIGGFQGAGDPTDAGWINPHTSSPITSDAYCSFPSGVVPGYPQSLAITWPATNNGSFGYPSLELQFSPAQIQAFNSNSWLTVTYSVPATTTAGYSQLYNIALNSPGPGYENINQTGWTNAMFSGNTNNNSPEPNYYFYSGEPSLFTQVVTLNYSAFTNAIIAGGESYLQMTLQGNQGGGAPTNWYINSVVLSKAPFGQATEATANVFVVDNFSTNGVGPTNPTNDDYYNSAQNYAAGDITNVYGNWFGSGAFSNVVYAPGVSPSYAPSQGSLAINLDWIGTAGDQFELWNQGPTNDFYSMNISGLTYTNFQCDVMFAPGSATNAAGNFGLLQFGNRPPSYGQDYFGGGNNGITVAGTNAGVWQHVSIALNPAIDTNLLSIQGLLIHIYDGSGQLSGPSTIYVDNIEFVGPLTVTKIPPPVVNIQPAAPGLRMFVGSSATYLREGVITTAGTGENNSWVGASGAVNYSFQLLSYPPANIGVTELAILPEASFNTTANFQTTIYNNPYLDYQDSNGLYMTIAPHGGGSVTATVQWKVGLLNSGPNNTVLTITNPTAIGTWTLSFSSATSGTLTAPGASAAAFTITDATVTADFANPAVAAVFEDPNSAAGYGLYEDYGTISITGTASGNQTENFANETADFGATVANTSPGGFFQNNYSVDPGNLVITRKGLDKYWASWTGDIQNNYALVTDTNILASPTNWISPVYYSDYNTPDETGARGIGVSHGTMYWELLPLDDLPTADGGFQPTPPAITDPLSPNAFFMLTTNTANIFPVTP